MNTPHTPSRRSTSDRDPRLPDPPQPDDNGFLTWLRSITRTGPRTSIALILLLLLLGTAAGVYVMSQRINRVEITMSRDGDVDDPAPDTSDVTGLEAEARDDIAQAIYYYERAIAKLDVVALRNEPNLDSAFVALQRERIRLLRASIDECKAALDENGRHPDVQHYLLTAYADLQNALQELAHGKN